MVNRNNNTWTDLVNKLKKGQVVSGIVFKKERHGVYIDIGENFYGIVLVPFLSNETGIDFEDYPDIGDNIKGVILDFSFNKRNIEYSYVSISMKDCPRNLDI